VQQVQVQQMDDRNGIATTPANIDYNQLIGAASFWSSTIRYYMPG
jgi:hypothetical protein